MGLPLHMTHVEYKKKQLLVFIGVSKIALINLKFDQFYDLIDILGLCVFKFEFFESYLEFGIYCDLTTIIYLKIHAKKKFSVAKIFIIYVPKQMLFQFFCISILELNL